MSSRSNQLKDDILNQIAEQIKGLQISQQKASLEGKSDFQVTTENIHLQCLLDLTDHILLHGLEHVEFGYWPFVRELTHSETVERVIDHPQVTNDLDKGRVWVFTAFSEGLLESYIRLFINSQKLARRFYTKSAFVRDKERLSLLQTLVSGLDFITITLNQERPYLGYGMSPSQEIVAKGSNNLLPVTAKKIEESPSHALREEDVSHSTASSFSNSSVVTGPLSPKSSSTSDSQDTVQNEIDETLKMDDLNPFNRLTPSDSDFQVVLTEESKDQDILASGAELQASYDQNISEFPFSRRINHSVVENSIISEHAKKESMKPTEDNKQAADEVDILESHVWYPEILSDSEQIIGMDFEDVQKEQTCEEAIGLSDSSKAPYKSQDIYPPGSNDSLHSSALSMDSLDQFCKDLDSSLNIATNSPTLYLCNNEDNKDNPQCLGNDSYKKKAGDSTGNALQAEENFEESSSDVQESSEYDGIILGLPKRPSLQEIPVTSCDVSVDQNTVLALSLGVFQRNNEQFNRMLVFMSGHICGRLCPVHILLTNNALYTLWKVPSEDRAGFVVEWTFPFATLKRVEVGLNCQAITIASKSHKCSFFVGDEAVTRDFLSSLTSMIVKSGLGSTLSTIISTATIEQETRIKRWLSELEDVQPYSIDIACFSLVHWYGLSGPDTNVEVLSYNSVKEGFLDCKQQQYLGIGPKWTTSYFVLTNGILYQHIKQWDKSNKIVVQLKGSRSGGCRRINDPDRQFAFEIVSESGSPIIVLAAPTESDASDWIFKLCQAVAETFDSQEDMGCTVMNCVPCCLTVTKEKIVTFLSDASEDYFQLLSGCSVQSVTRLFVDNDVRNYCILKFEHSEITSSEASWFIWFKTEYELAKFERAISDAWRELFKIDMQFLVLGEGSTRELARAQAMSIEDLYKVK